MLRLNVGIVEMEVVMEKQNEEVLKAKGEGDNITQTSLKRYSSVQEFLADMEEQKRKRPIYRKVYDSLWFIWHRIYWFFCDSKENVISFYQRGNKGFSRRDVWNLTDYLARVILKSVQELRNNHCSYPNEYQSEEEWNKVLDEIAYTMETAIKINETEFIYIPTRDFTIEKWQRYKNTMEKSTTCNIKILDCAEIRRYEAGWKLFVDNFHYLWD